jgi:hypothetical protein
MRSCPACSAEVDDSATVCPTCQLSVSLFDPVREAAGAVEGTDPVFLRTIAELIQSVDLAPSPGDPTPPPSDGGRSPPVGAPPLEGGAPPAEPALRTPAELASLSQLPALPTAASDEELERRASEYLQLGRRLGLDFGDVSSRLQSAGLTHDQATLSGLVREMFVHLAGALTINYESELGRRNELAQLVPTPSADVDFEAIRRAISVGDLPGAHRRLAVVHDELGRIEEEWATGRILATECDLLAETIRELGGDPSPALGPLTEGRKSLATGQRERAEHLLARAAIALWSLLEPRFFDDLKRLRDRLALDRSAGVEIAPALQDLRAVAVELKQRNFGGTIVSYRRLRAFVDRSEPPATPVGPVVDPLAEASPSHPPA